MKEEEIREAMQQNIGGLVLIITNEWERETGCGRRSPFGGYHLDTRTYLGRIIPPGLAKEENDPSVLGVPMPHWVFHLDPLLEKEQHKITWRTRKSPLRLWAYKFPLGEMVPHVWDHPNILRPWEREDPPFLWHLTGDLPAVEVFAGQEAIEEYALGPHRPRSISPLAYLVALRSSFSDFSPLRAEEFERHLAERALQLIREVRDVERSMEGLSKLIERKAELASKYGRWIEGGARVLCDDPVVATWSAREKYREEIERIQRLLADAATLGLHSWDTRLPLPDIPGGSIHVSSFFSEKCLFYGVPTAS